MAFELTPSLTAGDIVTKFRKKSYENMANKGIGPMQHPVFKRGLSFKGKAGAAQPLDNHHLFEVGGNIGKYSFNFVDSSIHFLRGAMPVS